MFDALVEINAGNQEIIEAMAILMAGFGDNATESSGEGPKGGAADREYRAAAKRYYAVSKALHDLVVRLP